LTAPVPDGQRAQVVVEVTSEELRRVYHLAPSKPVAQGDYIIARHTGPIEVAKLVAERAGVRLVVDGEAV
jgi:hypothetical protein